MAAIEDFSDDFPQYLADTARELAESSRRSLKKLEEERIIIVGLQRRTELAVEALLKSASGLSEASHGLHDISRRLHDACGGLRDYSTTSCDDMNRAIEALNQSREESKEDMRRMAEMSDMLAAFLSESRADEPEGVDPEPGPEDEDP